LQRVRINTLGTAKLRGDLRGYLVGGLRIGRIVPRSRC
jgi:hypothetical protein